MLHFATVRKCSTSNILILPCPPLSRCVQNQPDQPDATCECIEPNQFNPKYSNDSNYCIVTDKIPLQKVENNDSKSSRGSDSKTVTAGTLTDGSDPSYSAIRPPLPGAHHIVAGILIPVAFVIVAVCIVIIYKKLHITQRIRNIQRTRRNRPFYEDVMLGSNDIDDPPLI